MLVADILVHQLRSHIQVTLSALIPHVYTLGFGDNHGIQGGLDAPGMDDMLPVILFGVTDTHSFSLIGFYSPKMPTSKCKIANQFFMTVSAPANPALVGKIPPRPPFVKGGWGDLKVIFYIKSKMANLFNFDDLVKSQKVEFPVIPAKAGIQFFPPVISSLDSGFHRSDDFYEIINFEFWLFLLRFVPPWRDLAFAFLVSSKAEDSKMPTFNISLQPKKDPGEGP
jgi:hypothetical protein